MNFLNIVIPCYNEKESLPELISKLSNLDSRINFLIIENGSNDGSDLYLRNKKKELPKNVQIHLKKENTGYGAGVLEGLYSCEESKYIGWIHGDLQFEYEKLNNVCRDLLEISNKWKAVFYKGVRTGRNNSEKIISIAMGLIASLIIKKKFFEINAQPTIFSYSLLKEIENAPLDFSFDSYIYWLAVKNNYKLIRKEYKFPPRAHGRSKWNFNILSRIEFSINLIKYFIKLRNS